MRAFIPPMKTVLSIGQARSTNETGSIGRAFLHHAAPEEGPRQLDLFLKVGLQ